MRIKSLINLICVIFLCLVISCTHTKLACLPRSEHHQNLDSHYFDQLEEMDSKIVDYLYYLYSRQQISNRKYGTKAHSIVFNKNIPIDFKEYYLQRKELLQELENIMINERNNKQWSTAPNM